MRTNKFYLIPFIYFITGFLQLSYAQVEISSGNEDALAVKPSECIIKAANGSFQFYFDADYKLTKPTCSTIYRISEFNFEDVSYEGDFKDYYSSGEVATEGRYKNGVLNGECSVYYRSGVLWQEGTFVMGKMIGVWKYYYPDGKPMYTVDFNYKEPSLLAVWDVNSVQTLVNKSGKVKIPFFESGSVTPVASNFWTGEVQDGFLVGTWKETSAGKTTLVEEIYRKGKFVKGYDNGRFYNIFSSFSLVQDLNLLKSDLFALALCDETSKDEFVLPFYVLGAKKLEIDVLNSIGGYSPLKDKNVIASVSFLVKKDGTLTDFENETNYGIEKAIIRSLNELKGWEPAKLNASPVEERVTFAIHLRAKEKNPNQERSVNRSNQSYKDLRDQEKTFNPPSIYKGNTN